MVQNRQCVCSRWIHTDCISQTAIDEAGEDKICSNYGVLQKQSLLHCACTCVKFCFEFLLCYDACYKYFNYMQMFVGVGTTHRYYN